MTASWDQTVQAFYMQFEQKTGIPSTSQWGQELAADELNASWSHSMYPGGPLAGVDWSKAGVSPEDMMRVTSFAEQYANAIGWNAFPPVWALVNLAKQSGLDYQSFASQVFGIMPKDKQASMPFAKFGLNRSDFSLRQQQYSDIYQQYTGVDPLQSGDTSLIDQAMSGQWSTSRFQFMLQNSPHVQGQFGWVKYGYDYNAWQQYKVQNKSAIIARFGTQASATDSSYLADIAQPLSRFNASGSSFQQPSTQPGASVSGLAFGSAVR